MTRAGAAARRCLLIAPILLAAACQQGATAEGPPAPQMPAEIAADDTARGATMTTANAGGATLIDYGNSLLAVRESDLALKAFTRSITVEGVSAEALMGAGIAAAQLGMLNAARRHLEDARGLDPHSVNVNNNLGVVLFQLREYDLARDAFRTAYAASSGTSEFAEHNLNRAEAMLAAIRQTGAPDPAVTYRVERQGTSTFRLVEIEAAGDGAQDKNEPEE